MTHLEQDYIRAARERFIERYLVLNAGAIAERGKSTELAVKDATDLWEYLLLTGGSPEVADLAGRIAGAEINAQNTRRRLPVTK